MAGRILTTHAGSLPRPDDLADMVWERIDGKDVDEAELEARIDSAVDRVVARQREVGLDVISDGEMSKSGFSTYVNDRFSGFAGRSEFQSDDVAPFPNLAMKLFATPSMAHFVFSNCVGPVELTDKDAVHRDIARFKGALGDADPSTAFMGTISPGQIAFNYPDQHYGSHEKYLAACAEALSYEYRAIIDAGFNLQVDSPDMAMAAHSRSVGSSVGDWHHHLPLAVEALNGALEGIPPERVRFHVCWGKTGTPHTHDIRRQRVGRAAAPGRPGVIINTVFFPPVREPIGTGTRLGRSGSSPMVSAAWPSTRPATAARSCRGMWSGLSRASATGTGRA